MRILVCGSRTFGILTKEEGKQINFEEYELFYATLDVYLAPIYQPLEIISGRAPGADRLAEAWAFERQIPIHIYPARWTQLGIKAGPIRNKQMLIEGKPDLVIAFLAKDSRGTSNMIEQAEEAGVPVKIINV